MGKRRNWKLAIVAMLAGICMAGECADPPEVDIPKCEKPPVVNGKLDDECWKNAREIKEFFILKDKEGKKTEDTTVLFTRDRQWLYLAFKCKGPENMRDLEVKITERDGSVQRDDSVEIFFDPGSDGKIYYQYMLNFGNVRSEKKVTEKEGRKASWNVPWRSATAITKDGWVAEIALPLASFTGQGDLSKARLNICRTKFTPQYDQYKSKMKEDAAYSSLAKVSRGFHEPKSFAFVKNLQNDGIGSAFLPAIQKIEIGKYSLNGGSRSYDVNVGVRNFSIKSGKVKITVIDKPINGKESKISKVVEVQGKGFKNEQIYVPVETLVSRDLTVKLVNPDTGEILDTLSADNTSSLTLMSKPLLERNYYTSEKEARVKCISGFPEEFLKKSQLRIKNPSGKVISQEKNLKTETITSFPVSGLPVGISQITIELVIDGKVMSAQKVPLNKKAPNPGGEVKIDQFNKVVLKNGEPFFPFGFLFLYCVYGGGNLERHMKFVAESGFNTVESWGPTDYDKLYELAGKYNLNVVDFMKTHIGRKKRHLMDEDVLNTYIKSLEKAKKCPKMISYQTMDEPNLGGPEVVKRNVEHAKILNDLVNKHDGYHPSYLLFAYGDIPDGILKYCDIASDDIYMFSGQSGYTATPFLMINRTISFKKKLDKENKVTWIVPLAERLDPVRTPRPILPEEQLSQTYLTIIHGAKGVLYFNYGSISHTQNWQALSKLAQQMKSLGPAIVATDIKQNIRYSPVELSPKNGKYPDVQVRLIKSPEGEYLLMAANCKYFASNTKFSITGLKNGKVKNMFEDKSLPVEEGSFSVEFAPLGIKTFNLGKSPLKEPVEISVVCESLPEKNMKQYRVPNLREGCKNFIPNSTLDLTPLPGWPMYLTPYRVSALKGIGTPQSGWQLEKEGAKFGKHCLKLTRSKECWGVWIAIYPPVNKQPVPVVLSFYAKGEKDGDLLTFHGLSGIKRKSFKLTKDWKRYHVSGVLHPPKYASHKGKRSFLLYPRRTVWLDGFQMEYGDKPTEFTTK